VDEQARRAEQLRSERRALAWQLLALAGALAALAYGDWRLTRPATADDLAVRIQTAVEDNDGDPTSVENQIDEFLNRFADDPRAGDMAALAEEVRLRRLERQLRTKARLTRRRTVHPAEQVYAAAVSLLEVDPARSAAMLDDLLALYADSQEGDDAAPYLELARRQRAKAGDLLEQRQAEQLPQLQERLAAAAALRESDPRSAARIYQALVNLYGDEAWADPVVARARELLQTLGAAEPSRSD
ncbi:MAG TPA: hypothetical protein PKC18_14365, partial [Lacipirellulaceae bacterium]|nr:hypothetical protein [Lacipirellulaceae bacterium]